MSLNERLIELGWHRVDSEDLSIEIVNDETGKVVEFNYLKNLAEFIVELESKKGE